MWSSIYIHIDLNQIYCNFLMLVHFGVKGVAIKHSFFRCEMVSTFRQHEDHISMHGLGCHRTMIPQGRAPLLMSLLKTNCSQHIHSCNISALGTHCFVFIDIC